MLRKQHGGLQVILECIEDNFLIQVLDKLSRREVFLDLVLTNAEKLIKEMKIGDTLSCRICGRVCNLEDGAVKKQSQDPELQKRKILAI